MSWAIATCENGERRLAKVATVGPAEDPSSWLVFMVMREGVFSVHNVFWMVGFDEDRCLKSVALLVFRWGR